MGITEMIYRQALLEPFTLSAINCGVKAEVAVNLNCVFYADCHTASTDRFLH
jgi:hypothetical protein